MNTQNNGNHPTSGPFVATVPAAQPHLFNGQSDSRLDQGGVPMIQTIDAHSVTGLAPQLREQGRQHRRETVQAARLNGKDPLPPRLDKPMLLLALGGSGREIATEAKAIFLENFGQMPTNVRILAFDSAADPVTRWDSRHGKVVELERESEFYLLEPVPLAGIKRSRQHHPEIMERLGDSLDKIHRVNIHDGAAQERPQGLLSLMWNAPTVYPLIRQTVRQLVEREKAVDFKIDNQSGINVAVTGSTCGGQASGSMLDAAYFVQEALSELGELSERSRVVGMFVLPGAFANIDGPNLLPNSHSFALELDELMQGGGFHASYPGGLRIDNREAPFTYVYLLDGVDEQGRAWPNREEVCALGGRALCLLFGSEVGMQAIADSVNKNGVLYGVSPAGFGTYLGTVGQAVIRFPAAQVAQRCAVRQAAAMIRQHFLAPLPSNQPSRDPGMMGAAVIRDRLKLTKDGAPYQVQMLVPVGLDQARTEEVPGQLRTLFTHYQQRRVFGDFFVQMNEIGAGLKQEMAATLVARFETLLAEGKLTEAEQWLRTVQERLQQQQSALLTDQEALAAQTQQAQTTLDAADTELDRAAESLFFLRDRRMNTAMKGYLESANDLLGLRMQQRREELTGEVLHQGLTWSRQNLRQVEGVIARLAQTAERLDARGAELARFAVSRNEINLADEALVDSLYQQYAGDVRADARQAIAQSGSLLTWTQWTPDQLADGLTNLAAHAFLPLAEISVEAVLKQRWDDRSAQQWISRLEDLAAGAWNLDRSLLLSGSGLAEFTTLGVPDATDSIFATGGITLASTYDPERIVALRTVYGASLDTLKPATLWKRKYEQVAGRVPLHILPKFQRQDDRSLQHFALGFIFGHIDNAATWFYYKPEDELAGRLRLGQGLENALAAFRDKADLQGEIMRRITEQIAQAGTAAALERIDRYVAAGGKDDDDLTRSLRRAARDYAAELRRNRRAIGEESDLVK